MRSAPRANPYRDTWAGDLTAERAGTGAKVAGWVHHRRDHGGLIFVDLRDRSGIVQLVFHPENGAALFAAAERLRAEYVISVAGDVVRREEGQVNPNLATGEIEIQVGEMQLLAESQTPPFPLDSDIEVDEMLRLRHRTSTCAAPDERRARAAPRGRAHDPRDALRRGLPRDRDADPHEVDARGRARLPRAVAPAAGQLLRAAAVAAALQAAADGGRLRALLPDRALLPRRGSARRPPAGVHAARPRDVLRRGGGRHRRHRGASWPRSSRSAAWTSSRRRSRA